MIFISKHTAGSAHISSIHHILWVHFPAGHTPAPPLSRTRRVLLQSGPGSPFLCISMCLCVFRNRIHFSFQVFRICLEKARHTGTWGNCYHHIPLHAAALSSGPCRLLPTGGSEALLSVLRIFVFVSPLLCEHWVHSLGRLVTQLPLKSYHKDQCSL